MIGINLPVQMSSCVSYNLQVSLQFNVIKALGTEG